MGGTTRIEEVAEVKEGLLKGEEVLKKLEGKRREIHGPIGHVITVLAIGASVYHLTYAYFHPFFALDHRAIHWGFMSCLIFLLYPFSKKISPRERPSPFDLIFALTLVGICVWIFINSYEIMQRIGMYLDIDIIFGTILLILTLESARRSIGWSIPSVAIFFCFMPCWALTCPKPLFIKDIVSRDLRLIFLCRQMEYSESLWVFLLTLFFYISCTGRFCKHQEPENSSPIWHSASRGG